MSIKLKPCPFCGYEEVTEDEGLYPSGKFFNIVCGKCMASVQGENTVETISLWNTRPNDKLDRVRAEIEKMSKCGIMRSMPMTIRADTAKEILRIIDKIKSED